MVDRIRWLTDDFDYHFRTPESHFGEKDVIEIIEEAAQAVGVGQPHTVPGTWPPLIQLLYREQDFHIIGGKIFRKIDPIADALDGNWGSDLLDADEDTLENLKNQLADDPRAISFLETHPELFTDVAGEEDALYKAINGLNADQLSDFFELIDRNTDTDDFAIFGYRQPRDRYEFITSKQRHSWAEKAEERCRHFGDLKAEVSDIDDEEILNRFLWRIRDDYYEDKKLRSEWNEVARQRDRDIYLNSLHKQGFDEETIRRKVYFCFDCKKTERPNVYHIVDGKKVKLELHERHQAYQDYKRSKDSIWYQARSKALNDLVLTTGQWSTIYDIARRRRAAIREHDKELAIRSWKYLGKLKAYIDKAKTPKNIEELRVALPKHENYLTTYHRKVLWNAYKVRAQQITRSTA